MTDLILNDDFDLAFAGGDLVTGESTRQHQELLLLAAPGELRQFPAVGVGIREYLLDDVSIGQLNGAVKRSYETDGMTVRAISSRGQDAALNIDAIYG